MSGSLEVSITLDDVFSVVGGKRVPLAPELAGYLALEIAEGADAAGGDIDPKAVYIAEEGTVALVRPKRELATGNAEASVRAILARLLEASGSQTPALAAASRRKASGNLRALAEELEAALIPVNRAAGRRALARLAREVKRVTTGVGRNASAPPPLRGPTASQPAARAEAPRPPPNSANIPEESPTARRQVDAELIEIATPSGAGPAAAIVGRPAEPTPRPPTPAPRPVQKSAADVDSLLATFEVSSQRADHAVARDLKAMVGLDPTPPPPKSRAPDARSSGPPSVTDEGVEALLAMSDLSAPAPRAAPPPAPSPRAGAPPAASAPRAQRPSFPDTIAGLGPSDSGGRPKVSAQAAAPAPPARAMSTGSARVQLRPNPVRVSTAGEFSRLRARGADRALIMLAVILLIVAGGAIWMLKLPPGFITGRTPEKIAQEKAAADAARVKAAAAQQAASCKATVVVSDVPDNAEVLLRKGQAPVDVDHMPVGPRLEFVATAEGFAPKRTVVPSGASWDPGPDGKPRFEVAVQLDKAGKRDLWPPGEPGSEVGGEGPPGTVHIVSTPRGAEIWLLAGGGPEARVEQLVCNMDVDVLVAGPTTLRKRLHIGAADFGPDPSAGATGPTLRIAKISAK